MKKHLFLVPLLAISLAVSAQQNPLKWDFSAKKIADKTYEIHLKATIDYGWHTYSQTTPAHGPSPTKIIFRKNPLTVITGKPKEIGDLQQKYEEVFGVNVKYFSNEVDFVQVVKLKSNVKTTVAGTVEFMVCTDERCLPPATQSFSIDIIP